jgi:hypothetical protein
LTFVSKVPSKMWSPCCNMFRNLPLFLYWRLLRSMFSPPGMRCSRKNPVVRRVKSGRDPLHLKSGFRRAWAYGQCGLNGIPA